MTFDRWSRGACKFRCGVCHFVSECSAEFWKHVAKDHVLNIAEYKAKYGNPCVTYKEIQCLGCHKLLRYDPGTLANHASHAHDLSMEDFYEAFFKPPVSESSRGTCVYYSSLLLNRIYQFCSSTVAVVNYILAYRLQTLGNN